MSKAFPGTLPQPVAPPFYGQRAHLWNSNISQNIKNGYFCTNTVISIKRCKHVHTQVAEWTKRICVICNK